MKFLQLANHDEELRDHRDSSWAVLREAQAETLRKSPDTRFGMTLNVGPLPDGSFQKAARRRLKEFAAWMEINESALQPTNRSPFAKDVLPEYIRSTLGIDQSNPSFNLFVLKPLPAGDLILPQPLKLLKPTTEFRAQVIETCELLKVKLDQQGNLAITIPNELAGIDHPVIRVGPATSIPIRYEDGTSVEPVKPGTFHK